VTDPDDWSDRLHEKTDRYEALLAEALDAAEVAADLDDTEVAADRDDTEVAADLDADAAEQCLEMAAAYLRDGRHFRETGDLPDALAAFSYGHGWLDAGARIGVLDVPEEGHLFTQ